MSLSSITKNINCLLVVFMVYLTDIESTARDGWGPWTAWSICSATCGQGLVYSQRRCHRLASQNSCHGHSKRFKLCKLRECEEIPEDPTIALCRQQNHIRYGGKRFYWEPYINPSTPCELSCKARGHHYVYNVKKLAADGSNCGVKDKAICLAGRCMKVGCDGILDSGAVVDRCGICGGTGNTCRLIAGAFSKPYLAKYGYNLIVSIPPGARSISISEYARSRNFFAVKSAGRYFINGHRRLHRTGGYQVAGTTFVYKRHQGKSCPGECLTASGPINQTVDIELLYYHKNPGIKYQYTILHRQHRHQQRAPQRKIENGHILKTAKTAINTIPEEGIPLSKPYIPPDGIPLDKPAPQKNDLSSKPIPPNGIPLYKSYGDPLIRKSADNRLIIRNRAASGEDIKSAYEGQYPRYIPSRSDTKQPFTSHLPHNTSLDLPSESKDFEKKHYIHTDTYDKQAARSSYGSLLLNNSLNAIPDITASKKDDNSIYGLSGSSDRSGLYSWRISGFTDCSVSCGGGNQDTKIVCVKGSSQVVVTDDNCDIRDKPVVQRVVCNTKPCPAEWFIGNWTSCSVTCDKGSQSRLVECRRRITPTLIVSVSASLCIDQPKPQHVRKCQVKPCIRWHVGNWTKCSTHCGHGQRYRDVMCVDGDGEMINEKNCTNTKPEEEEICDMGSCVKGWYHTRWSKKCSKDCGRGYVTRDIFCSADDGSQLPDKQCSATGKPSTRRKCKNKKPCGGVWFTGPWSKCNSTCGYAVKTRGVTCMRQLRSDVYTTTNPNKCLEEKPESQEVCIELPPCKPRWYKTDWSECTKTCGSGIRTREVKCLNSKKEPDMTCNKKRRPSERESCKKESCEKIAQINTNLQRDSAGKPCSDTYVQWCGFVKQARICEYNYYKQLCCKSCTLLL